MGSLECRRGRAARPLNHEATALPPLQELSLPIVKGFSTLTGLQIYLQALRGLWVCCRSKFGIF